MSKPIRVKLVLERRQAGDSMREIVRAHHIAKQSVSDVCKVAESLQITYGKVKDLTEEEAYRLIFPDKQASSIIYDLPDYDYVQSELAKPGVNIKLLFKEYLKSCREKGTIAVGKSKFYDDYNTFCAETGFSNRIIHKPGVRTEVDWSGLKMKYHDDAIGCEVAVPVFVSALPFSQYCYVEPCRDMKQQTWNECHIHMWEHFGGSTPRLVCDNLKTGVISHPKDGDIILNDEYENLASHYGCAIMPTGVRKPKHKASVEGNVGNIETSIIAALRNERFHSLEQVKAAAARKLSEFNDAPFEERDGSRTEVFLREEKPLLIPLPKVRYESLKWYRNHKYVNHFTSWASSKPYNVKVLDDGSISNETRLGAVKDVHFAIDSLGLDSDMLVIAGDNVLDFSFCRFIDYALSKRTTCVMRYYEPFLEKIKKSSALEIDENDLILNMVEKPLEPASHWCCPPFYYYTREDSHKVVDGIAAGCGTDAPGSYIAWLSKVSPVHAFEMPGKRYDIGNLESYGIVQRDYKGILN